MTTRGIYDAVMRLAQARVGISGLLACVLGGGVGNAISQTRQGDGLVKAAEEQIQAEQAKAGVEDELPAITVKARGVGVEEQAKDLPFGISVMTGEEIEQRRLFNVEDALRSTPGVSVNSSGGANVSSTYIRGVGALYPMSMDDTSVVVNIDGSPVSTRHTSLGNLDIEQVEVLKGPQGTLFGGLGEAGAVNITTRKPTRHFEGYVRAAAGQDANRSIEAALSGPLTSALSGRLAILQSGYEYPITNWQTGGPLSKPDTQAYRGHLQWDISARTSALFTAERQRLRHMGENIVLRPYGKHPAMDVTPSIYDDSRKTVERYSLRWDHGMDNSRITSITSFVDGYNTSPVIYDRRVNEALTGYPSEYWEVQESRERVWTQDLRWSSLPQSDVFWAAGISALHSDRSYDNPRNTYGASNAQFRDFTSKRYGIYGEATYPLSADLKLTSGLRHTWDKKTYEATYRAGADAFESERLKDNFSTGRLGLTYAVTRDTNVYATLARGYNPGGFNDYGRQLGDGKPYRAGTANSLEIGLKSAGEDKPYAFNAAFFVTRVKDNHLLSYDSKTYASAAVNADTQSRGVEMDARWRFKNGFTLSAAMSYTDTDIRTSLLGIGGGDVLAGNRVPDIPKWSGTIGVNYRHVLPEFLGMSSPILNTNLNYQYVGSRPADPQNSFDLGSYSKVDMRIGIANKNAEFYIWGRNLLDKRYDLYGYMAVPPATTYGAPAFGRTLGVGVDVYF